MTPALSNAGALFSIGSAILYTVGLNPQRLSYASDARFPAHPVQGGIAYQITGAGQERLTIEAVTFPHVVGGLDALALLKGYHRAQSIVPYVRLRGNYLGESGGMVAIETLDYDEERLHPFDGVGRQIDVSLGLLLLPAESYLGQTGRIADLGGLL
ncbi:phage tail protein [Pannonibacter sp. SL95]|uniref:phage tail protein n=1 Tax=Pannonibacter sp. SL95 TaxID=2995153 RepID=UPI00227679CF|nr:phage tail protein [Pannonibacter sp. SL95]MCY1705469.1 phage tail protein [Pannonibacter sp. SL95]